MLLLVFLRRFGFRCRTRFRLLLCLHIQRFEINGLQHKLREAALLDDVGNGLARIREQDTWAVAAYDRFCFSFFVTCQLNQARLLLLNEEHGLFVFLGVYRNRQNDLL